MPRITDNIPIDCSFLKKSSKLIPCQKEMVIYWGKRGASQRQIAQMFNVSRRLIQFILNPDSHKKNLESRRERGGSKIYYKKETHTKAIREHRQYKKELLTQKNI
jgi:transposase